MTTFKNICWIALCGLVLAGCGSRNNSSGAKAESAQDRIPAFFKIASQISEVHVEQVGKAGTLKLNAGTRPEECSGLLGGVKNASIKGELSEKTTHKLDFRHPEGGVFAYYAMDKNCLYFKDMGDFGADGPVVWPAAGFAAALKTGSTFWEGDPVE